MIPSTWVLLGAGGHARVLMDALKQSGQAVSGVYVPPNALLPAWGSGLKPVHTDEQLLSRFPPDASRLILGIGSVGDNRKRMRLFNHYRDLGYHFASVLHPGHLRGEDVLLGEGCQIMAGVVLQPGSSIGDNVIVNTGVCVDHECVIGDHVHLAPGVVLSGGVRIECAAHIGTGAVVIQGIRIGAGALVAAGATVVRHVAAGARVAGIPARPIISNQQGASGPPLGV
ncbi:MAG: acetyltransferase [Magnetococcales bacterium]|nr:acetyltransferase [Magnetococcales bacterium]MBF0148762.1 acetyltransferase [Magnetococcales bacterium]MBF0174207.1 acetyltransferase [Magnetococcales bacterium]MBF0348103.1 acetyltransferase [Magnetococcales bacterium]MBF0629592.1 acetyltransferase [Magnetococcales bacterium]